MTPPVQSSKIPQFNTTDKGRNFRWWRLAAAVVSGLVLAACFPPLEWHWLTWFALLPLLCLPAPNGKIEQLLVGYLFGYTFFAASLLWLNQVGFGAGFILAAICAAYPMLWYLLFCQTLWFWRRRNQEKPNGASWLHCWKLAPVISTMLLSTAAWTALEWARGWVFTGFPWNFLAVTQYRNPNILAPIAVLGSQGLSAFIILVNLATANILGFTLRLKAGHKLSPAWSGITLLLAMLLFLTLAKLPRHTPPLQTPSLKILAIQGDIPQCRQWSEEEFALALKTYCNLTKDGVKEYHPDLVIWPESAVPTQLNYPDYALALTALQSSTKTPLLLGAVDLRQIADANPDYNMFNSAFLLDENARILAHYDKIHRVPFGEYVPFGDFLPWLKEIIDMGRDLTPGHNYTIFALPQNARAGCNICFEDAFPEISRNFTRLGANLLITIANDAWYNHSAGARQHLSQAVLRAVECRRPLFRSGNNSETCYITPYGEITGLLVNPQNGSHFFRGMKCYELPVWNNWGETFYVKHGDFFPHGCAALTLLNIIILAVDALKRHAKFQRILKKSKK